MDELITLTNATISRPGRGVVLRDLNWTLREGETWAVIGPTGCGKTTFAELLCGRLRLVSGTVSRHIERVELLAFREESRLFSPTRHYYQERFNFSDPLDDPTLDEFLHAGMNAHEGAINRI